MPAFLGVECPKNLVTNAVQCFHQAIKKDHPELCGWVSSICCLGAAGKQMVGTESTQDRWCWFLGGEWSCAVNALKLSLSEHVKSLGLLLDPLLYSYTFISVTLNWLLVCFWIQFKVLGIVLKIFINLPNSWGQAPADFDSGCHRRVEGKWQIHCLSPTPCRACCQNQTGYRISQTGLQTGGGSSWFMQHHELEQPQFPQFVPHP